MKHTLIGLVALFLFASCLNAPSNGRDNGSKNSPRTGQNDPCANCAIGSLGNMKSQMYRTRGTDQLSLENMQKALTESKLPDTYRTVTNRFIDNDSQITPHSQDYEKCGDLENLKSVKAKLNHCFNVNGDKALWVAKTNGIAGESDWRLVTYDKENGITLWIDTTTNLVWSHILKAQAWDIASGVAAEEDEKTYCESLTDLTHNKIHWRLPNRNEFLQADLNGARFVLKDTQNFFWTASSDINQSNAWSIDQSSGVLKSVDRNMPLSVRCLGVIIK